MFSFKLNYANSKILVKLRFSSTGSDMHWHRWLEALMTSSKLYHFNKSNIYFIILFCFLKSSWFEPLLSLNIRPLLCIKMKDSFHSIWLQWWNCRFPGLKREIKIAIKKFAAITPFTKSPFWFYAENFISPFHLEREKKTTLRYKFLDSN